MLKNKARFIASYGICYISDNGRRYTTKDFLSKVNEDGRTAFYLFNSLKGEELEELLMELSRIGKLQYLKSGQYVLTIQFDEFKKN